MHSNNTCISVSTSPQPHLQSSYFHVILSLPFTGKHAPLAIGLILAPTLPSVKLLFLGLSFKFHLYSFSLSVSLKPSFHAILLHSCMLSQIYLFHPCCCLPTPMALASGGSPMFPLVVHQPASPSIWPAVQSLRRGLSTNPGATMWCVCGCS